MKELKLIYIKEKYFQIGPQAKHSTWLYAEICLKQMDSERLKLAR